MINSAIARKKFSFRSWKLRFCTWMVCLMVIPQMTEAEDISLPTVEMDLLFLPDGTKVSGTVYPKKQPIYNISIHNNISCFSFQNEDGTYEIVDKQTFRLVAKLKSNPHVYQNGYTFGKNHLTFNDFNNKEIWSCESIWGVYMTDFGLFVRYNSNPLSPDNDGNIQGVDAATGEILWSRHISHLFHFPWWEFRIDSLTMDSYLVGDELYLLNLKTGMLKSHPFKVSIEEPISSVFSIARSVPMSSLDWTLEKKSATATHGKLSGLHSQWACQGDSMFIADAENVYCFDKSLNEIWRAPIPEGWGSKSKLRIFGNQLYLLNFGAAFQQGYVGKYGQVFYATFDIKTGVQNKMVKLQLKKKLYGGTIVPGRVYLQDNSYLYSIEEGSDVVKKIEWRPCTDVVAEDIPERVIYDTVYVEKNGVLEAVTTDAHQLVVELNDCDVNVISENGEVTKYNGSNVFFHDYLNVYSTNGKKGHNYAIVNSESKSILAEFYCPSHYCEIMKNGDIWVADKPGIGVCRDPFHLCGQIK